MAQGEFGHKRAEEEAEVDVVDTIPGWTTCRELFKLRPPGGKKIALGLMGRWRTIVAIAIALVPEGAPRSFTSLLSKNSSFEVVKDVWNVEGLRRVRTMVHSSKLGSHDSVPMALCIFRSGIPMFRLQRCPSPIWRHFSQSLTHGALSLVCIECSGLLDRAHNDDPVPGKSLQYRVR